MRRLLLILALAGCSCPLAAFAAEPGDFIAEFYDARKLKGSDAKAAIGKMIHSFEQAAAAGNADYTSSAGLDACHWLYARGQIAETGALARRAIIALAPLEPVGAHGDAVRRVQFFGFLERSLLTEGRIGAAWQANRAAAETLRGRKVTAGADGPAITVAEVIAMEPERRSMGWRLLEREADLLDLSGRTLQARALLDEAAAWLTADWLRKVDPSERFYVFKLLANRAMIIDFIGDERAALDQQESLFVTNSGDSELRPSYLTLHLNLLRNRSQWLGPSAGLLQEAREVAAATQNDPRGEGVNRLLAKMELDLQQSQDALAALKAEVKTTADLGRWFESVYARRDSLIARSKSGESGLDQEFIALLAKARTQGNKRTEPGLYQEYGDYLIARKRPAEAIPVLLESLRLTRSFGLALHEPALLGTLFDARFDAGDLNGARVTLAELQTFIRTHPLLPAARRVRAEVCLALALSRLGDAAGVHAALARARQAAAGLPDYQKSWLTPEVEARLTAVTLPAAAPSSVPLATPPPLEVQPLELVSIAPPGSSSRSRFAVFNPTAQAISGQLEITGPGAVADAAGKSVTFTAGSPSAVLHLPRTLSPGGEASLPVVFASAAGIPSAAAKVAWKNPGQETGPASDWTVSWDPAAKNSIVLNGSSLAANPFRFVSLFHEIAVPPETPDGIPFRLRSASPLRLEYYDARNQELLAIDANGNGSFDDPGDLHGRSAAGEVTAAIVPASPDGKPVQVEVHLFAIDGLPILPAKAPVSLTAEVWRDGAWTQAVEDLLR